MTLPHDVVLRFGRTLFVVSEHSSKILDLSYHGGKSGVQLYVVLLGWTLLGCDIA